MKLARHKPGYGRARDLYQRALTMSERVFGPEHPTTAMLMSNLAAVQSDLGERGVARQLLERSLALHEQIFGPEHPNTAWVLINLGDLDHAAGDYSAARERYIRGLIIREAALGARHPLTVYALRQLVTVLGDLSDGDPEALRLSMPLYQCLVALDPDIGANSPLRGMGVAADPERAAARLHALVARLAAQRRQAPPTGEEQDALSRAAALERRAESSLAAGDLGEAQAALEEAIALREQAQGPAHLDLVAPLGALEQVMVRLGRPSAVLPLRQRAVEIQMQALGADHPLALNALTDLMGLVSYEYGPEATGPLQERLLHMLEEAFGPDASYVRMIRGTVEGMRDRGPSPAEPPARSRSERREAALAEPDALAAELLTDVEATPWHRLHHAYGTAEDVPTLLRMLLSADEEVCEEGFEQLANTICHQGTIYEASAHVAPFLLRMLADPRTPESYGVLGLLSALARGRSYLAAHHREEDSPFNLRAQLAAQGGDFDRQLARELEQVRAANAAVGEGAELLLGLAADPGLSDELRELALEVLAALPGRAELTVPRLQAQLAGEGSPALRAALALALHELCDDGPASRAQFAALLAADAPDALRLIAAVGLLTRAGPEAPEVVVEAALGALGTLGAHRHQFDAPEDERAAWREASIRLAPAWGPGPLALGLRGLRALGGERARAALMWALRLQRDQEDAELVAMALLEQAFGVARPSRGGISYMRDETGQVTIDYWGASLPPARQADELTDGQRELLTAMAAYEPLWERPSNMLELFGLPSERAALRGLLAHGGER